MRLDKAVAFSGASRAQARKMIQSGHVTVNRLPITAIDYKLQPADSIEIDGSPLQLQTHIHLMMNKPQDVLTAVEDARGMKTVSDFLPSSLQKRGLGPVGRLDKDVTGLILMTTDGQLAHRLISPKRHVEKVYHAYVEGTPDEADAKAFESGIPLKDFTCLPAKLILSGEGECRVTVMEGKFHQVKRMLAAVGHPVIRLHREKIGKISLDEALKAGEYRFLTEEEVESLYESAGLNYEK